MTGSDGDSRGEPVEIERSSGPGNIRTLTQQVDLGLVVSLAGELDLFTEPTARTAAGRALAMIRHPMFASAGTPTLVIDLCGLTLLSARGLQMLVRVKDAAAEPGIDVRIATGTQAVVLRPLRAAGLDQYLHVHLTCAEALEQQTTSR